MMKRYLYLLLCLFFVGCASFAEGQIITTIAGTGVAGYAGDGGAATAAKLRVPAGFYRDPSGNLFVADASNNVVRKITPAGIISTVAGTGVAGYNGDDILATAALLSNPADVVGDSLGNLYVCDFNNYRVRKIDPSGIITTIAGKGTPGYTGDNGAATGATFHSPLGLTMDAQGNLYIADQTNCAVRKIALSTGIITTFVGRGTPGYSGDGGPATAAYIHNPNYVYADVVGNIYITDNANHVIRKVDTVGVITTVVGTGVPGYNGDNISATSAELKFPAGVRKDVFGNLYIADAFNYRIRKIDTSGIITTIAGTGTPGYSGDGCIATAAEVNEPLDLDIDSAGNILIADAQNNRIRELTANHAPYFVNGHSQSIVVPENYFAYPIDSQLRAADSDMAGTETWALLSTPLNGTVNVSYTANAQAGVITPVYLYYKPNAGFIGTDAFSVKISDCVGAADTTTIHVTVAPVTPAGSTIITTIAGQGGVPGYTGDDGQATAATMNGAAGVVYDAAGNLYVSDFNNNVIRKVNPAGIITTFAGTGTSGNIGDGGPATAARLAGPTNLAFDATGNLYIAAYNGNSVRRISPAGVISTFAGNGTPGYSGDNMQATATELFHPSGVAVDDSGNVFIADYSNERIRKVNTGGIITTIAGTGGVGSFGEGVPAVTAQFHGPYGVALDDAGNLYIGDAGNNEVRKISGGIITTFAGTGTAGSLGDGTAATSAQLNNPPGMAVDHFGNVYIADQFNDKVRKVDASGIITTVAGTGTAGFSGDGCRLATNAMLRLTGHYTIDPSGSLVICDNNNDCVRKLVPNHAPYFTIGHSHYDTVCENTIADSIKCVYNGGGL